MYVICQFFSHQDATRAAEFEHCLRDHIRQGFQLILFEEDPAPEDIRRGATRCVPHEKRLTYDFALQWANENLPTGSVVALINLDIMLRFGQAAVEGHLQQYPNHFLCLSRLEYRPATGKAEPDPMFESLHYMNCQDAWVFRVPVPVFPRADFAVGNCPGCDNAIAYRAAEAGMIPLNLAGTFPIWHYDCRTKELTVRMTYDGNTELVRPERGGRLFLPRIAVGGRLHEVNVLTSARNVALHTVEKGAPDADAKMSNFLACLVGQRLVGEHWDWRYLLGCIALNNATSLKNP
jgi:hypothetical protein